MSRTLLTLVLAAMLAIAPAAANADTDSAPALVPDTTQFFLDNTGSACGPDAVYVLTTTARTGGPNCGYIGGAPFSEVFTQLGDTDFGTNTYAAKSADLPVTLDADEDVTGQITVLHQGGTTGVGQLVVDITLSGREGNSNRTIGSTTVETIVLGDVGTTTLEFELPIPDALAGAELNRLSLDVNVRGVHVNTGYTSAQGDSSFILPILVEATPSAAVEG